MLGVKLIPFYRVSYHGEFYEAKQPFDVDPADLEELSRHGKVLDEPAFPAEEPEEKPKRGRPRRTEDG